MEDKIGIIIQASALSTRLPQKVLLPILGDLTILDVIIKRCQIATDYFPYEIPIIVSISQDPIDDKVEELVRKYDNVEVHRRHEHENVLDAFIDILCVKRIRYCVRICGDNPFISYKGIVRMIQKWEWINECHINLDYSGFTIYQELGIRKKFGFFSELVSLGSLMRNEFNDFTKERKENVTEGVYSRSMTNKIDKEMIEMSHLIPFMIDHNITLSVDTLNDYNRAKLVMEYLNVIDFEIEDVEKACEKIWSILSQK